ncbi:uncharacterized protein LOC128546216 [Mercenaria mercenaria]|uniref:uncharacterized protein LOC128546216 n=1 Tax=Mercenaria mercenaria TaxID=6596 RepID=UPI00234EB621|nr:uncharacterized protein LOC128546216 [Mercenaria mercenaria]
METAKFTSAKKSRSALLAQLTKINNELERQMVSTENAEKVKHLYKNLCDRYEQFKNAHFHCLELCDDPSIIELLETNYSSQQKNLTEFNEHYSEWQKQSLQSGQDDNISTISRTGTARSSRAQLQNAKAKRLIAEHKLRTLKVKQKIEQEQRELENKRQLLEQESELEEARIEESVWQEDIECPDNNGGRNCPEVARDVSVSVSGQDSAETVISHDESNDKLEDLTSTNIDTAFYRLAFTLQEGFNVPKPELLTFNGRVTDYCKFIKNFETNVEEKISDSRLRLSYLIQYCVGEAKSCIEDCVLLDPDDGYRRARKNLQTRYDYDDFDGVWIGLNDIAKEGEFVWSNGGSVLFDKPVNYNTVDADCVYFYNYGLGYSISNNWYAAYCNGPTFNYVYERGLAAK